MNDQRIDRPFPRWVIFGFIALSALVLFASYHNMRFFRGYMEARRAIHAFSDGDVDTAFKLMEAAAKNVPESQDLRKRAVLYHGVWFLKNDNSTDALPLLLDVRADFGGDPDFASLLLSAQANVAFEKKQYDKFLQIAQAQLELTPGSAFSVAGVASAYACKYAETGKEDYAREALRYVEIASKMVSPNDIAVKQYEQRIRHRLATREIITRQEYERSFPQGWHQGTGQ